MNLDEDIRAKIAQAIAMVTVGTMRLYAMSTDESERKACDVAIHAAGWALTQLGECKPGDDAVEVCNRLVDRHNQGLPPVN